MITEEMAQVWGGLPQGCNCDEQNYLCEGCYTRQVRTSLDRFVRTGKVGELKSKEQVVEWLVCLTDKGNLSKLQVVAIIEAYGFKK